MASQYQYDRVPFRSAAVPHADCRRIETIARLFGLTAAPCAHARVLELGCGSAANLISLAVAHPRAHVVGCDLSERALASARRTIDALGVSNVELRHADICDVDDGWGAFDYVLCHDVFSWVAPRVRQKILEILSRNLAARGVAYVSYAVLPGWQLRGVVRDMVRHHTARNVDPGQAVERARALLSLGAAAQDQQSGPYAELMREEYYLFSAMSDEQVYHQMTTPHHQPFYFHEFVDLIGGADLQFLSDADVTRLFGPREPAAVREFLDALPRLEQQQYLDFLTNCLYRGALVCHRDVEIRDRPDGAVLRDCWISLAPARADLDAPDALIQEALSSLEDTRPAFVACSDLPVSGSSPTAWLMDAYAARKIDLMLSPPRISSRISDRPTVSPLVRLQAQDGEIVTNQKCEAVRLTDQARQVVTLLDGAHSGDDVAALVGEEIRSGRILRRLRDHALLVA